MAKHIIGVRMTEKEFQRHAGGGQPLSITVPLKAFVGPSAVIDRAVHLILDEAEAFNLARRLLGILPVTYLTEGRPLEDLRALMRVVEAGAKNTPVSA